MPFHLQPLLFLVLGFAGGTLVSTPGGLRSRAVAIAFGLALSIASTLRPRRVPLLALVASAASAGSLLASIERAKHERLLLPPSVASSETAILIEGILATEPAVVEGDLRFDVDATGLTFAGRVLDYRGRLRVHVRLPEGGITQDVLRQGDTIRAWADLRAPAPVRSPGGFDQAEWARRERIHGFATCKNLRLVTLLRRSSDVFVLRAARRRLLHSWRHVTDQADRSVTASMVVGDENALDSSTREEFRQAGLLHLLVVSGSQVAALVAALRALIGSTLRRTWPGFAIEAAILVAYCLVAGAGESIVRATVMALAVGAAARIDLHRSAMNFLWGAALVLLCLEPLALLDPGMQLSFVATAALVRFALPLSRRLLGLRLPVLLTEVVAAACVATIATMPLTLFWFHRVSLVSLAANLLAAPLAAALLYASLLTAGLDLIAPALAAPGGDACAWIASTLRFVAHHAASLDPDWRGPAPGPALLVAFAAAFLAAGWRRRVIPVAAFLGAMSTSPTALDGRLRISFLDVGQGDAILVETPKGRVIAIDAGPAFARFDAGERIVAPALWSRAHVRLERLILTHRHADHRGGADFLMKHFTPGLLQANADSAMETAGPARLLSVSDRFSVDGVMFRVLHPGRDADAERDENERSVVLEVRYGAIAILLMGDAGERSERNLSLDRTYAIVKAGHHGARNSSSQSFVDRTHASNVVFCVGVRNRFGHPHASVVSRWQGSGARVWRTDRDATIRFASDGLSVTRE